MPKLLVAIVLCLTLIATSRTQEGVRCGDCYCSRDYTIVRCDNQGVGRYPAFSDSQERVIIDITIYNTLMQSLPPMDKFRYIALRRVIINDNPVLPCGYVDAWRIELRGEVDTFITTCPTPLTTVTTSITTAITVIVTPPATVTATVTTTVKATVPTTTDAEISDSPSSTTEIPVTPATTLVQTQSSSTRGEWVSTTREDVSMETTEISFDDGDNVTIYVITLCSVLLLGATMSLAGGIYFLRYRKKPYSRHVDRVRGIYMENLTYCEDGESTV